MSCVSVVYRYSCASAEHCPRVIVSYIASIHPVLGYEKRNKKTQDINWMGGRTGRGHIRYDSTLGLILSNVIGFSSFRNLATAYITTDAMSWANVSGQG